MREIEMIKKERSQKQPEESLSLEESLWWVRKRTKKDEDEDERIMKEVREDRIRFIERKKKEDSIRVNEQLKKVRCISNVEEKLKKQREESELIYNDRLRYIEKATRSGEDNKRKINEEIITKTKKIRTCPGEIERLSDRRTL